MFTPRKAGEHRIAVLQQGDDKKPVLAVEFITPDFLELSKAEAAGARAIQAVRENSEVVEAYGFPARRFENDELPGLSRLIISVETAFHLWRDWNFAEVDPATKQPVVLELNRTNIARLLEDQQVRAVWGAHLEAASPLERDEGNGSAASPTGTTAKAATSAPNVESSTDPAPAGGETTPETSAPG
ncbi:hypothetical protein [Caulobacter sp. Root343]|uniref:hypothetical protein n=1 Tax=Caulobacter sp. Root343 TaxID=1736520 RepID=UPI0012E3ADBD|nr:hypothetical protein [Caulobacter sp. Root343]